MDTLFNKHKVNVNPLARHPKEWRHLDVSCSSLVGEVEQRGNNRLLRDGSFESCLTEQRCSVDLPCVMFCFVLLIVRPLSC